MTDITIIPGTLTDTSITLDPNTITPATIADHHANLEVTAKQAVKDAFAEALDERYGHRELAIDNLSNGLTLVIGGEVYRLCNYEIRHSSGELKQLNLAMKRDERATVAFDPAKPDVAKPTGYNPKGYDLEHNDFSDRALSEPTA